MTLTTKNGGNTIVQGEPLPKQRPDIELPIQISGREPRWYETFPVIRWCAVIGLALMAAPAVIRFVAAALHNA